MTQKYYEYDILPHLNFEDTLAPLKEVDLIKIYLVDSKNMSIGIRYALIADGIYAQIFIEALDHTFILEREHLTVGKCTSYERALIEFVKFKVELCLPDKHTLQFNVTGCTKVTPFSKWNCISNSSTVKIT